MATMIVRACDVCGETGPGVEASTIAIEKERFEIDFCQACILEQLNELYKTLRSHGRSLDPKPRKKPVQVETECPECGETFKSKSGMGRHRTARHKDAA